MRNPLFDRHREAVKRLSTLLAVVGKIDLRATLVSDRTEFGAEPKLRTYFGQDAERLSAKKPFA